MTFSKSIALALLASTASVNSFSTPKPSLGVNHKIVSPSDSFYASQHQPSTHHSFDSSLQFWKNGDVEPMDTYVEATLEEPKADVPASTLAFVGSSLLAFTYIIQRLQIYLNTPCLNGDTICTEKYYSFAQFFTENQGIGFGLILTHAIPFVLLPWVSKKVSEMGPTIKKDFEGFNPFLMQMAMACMGFGLSLEFGWHVSDSWYYDNNFHVLNFGFYFFLISGFALWADGFKNVPIMDFVFGIILAAATVLYPYGNAYEVGEVDRVPEFLRDSFVGGASSAKVPLYIGMSATFLEITRRGKEIFGNQMLWVPFFCIGVNLSFIFLLDGYKFDPETELNSLNYIYHICHDVLGTELGVLIFGFLIKNYVPLAERPSKLEAEKSTV